METDKDISKNEYSEQYKIGVLTVLNKLFDTIITCCNGDITKDMLLEFSDKMVDEIKWILKN